MVNMPKNNALVITNTGTTTSAKVWNVMQLATTCFQPQCKSRAEQLFGAAALQSLEAMPIKGCHVIVHDTTAAL
jgi:hypothetical protein